MRTTTNTKLLLGLPFLAATLALAPIASAKSFKKLAGSCGQAIAAGDGTSPWIVSCNGALGGAQPDYWLDYYNPTNASWVQTSGAGVEIAVGYQPASAFGPAMNVPLTLTAAGLLYIGSISSGSDIGSSTGQASWGSPVLVGGVNSGTPDVCATSVTGAVFVNGGVCNYAELPFLIGCGPMGVGGYVPLADASYTQSGPFTRMPGDAVRISISSDGAQLWSVNSTGGVYAFNGGAGFLTCNSSTGTWGVPSGLNWGTPKPGSAIDVSAGSGSPTNEPAWMVSTTYGLNRWNGSGWTAITGGPTAAYRVSVGRNGTVWVVDTNFAVWYYN